MPMDVFTRHVLSEEGLLSTPQVLLRRRQLSSLKISAEGKVETVSEEQDGMDVLDPGPAPSCVLVVKEDTSKSGG